MLVHVTMSGMRIPSNHPGISRRKFLASSLLTSALSSGFSFSIAKNIFAHAAANPQPNSATGLLKENVWQESIDRGLEWLVSVQSRAGNWNNESYSTAITALAGLALVCSGSTTIQGQYSESIRKAVDFLVSRCRNNGLIGDPQRDDRYTYGHGFSMLFLSQVLGEEEDADRREELVEILSRAVEFSVNSQMPTGGWGYVSSQENDTFDEGSTTITQVQGLRGCRNAGIVVPKESIEKARQYIYDCIPSSHHGRFARLFVQRRGLRQRAYNRYVGVLSKALAQPGARGAIRALELHIFVLLASRLPSVA
jgi:hypothetical protein